MPSLPKPILLEVERKLTALRHHTLLPNSGSPPFHSVIYRGKHSFHDTYFDQHDLLSHGLWLRQRNDTWQMKVRGGGDRVNSRFEELSHLMTIAAKIQTLTLNRSATPASNFGLDVLAGFGTTRRTWLADQMYSVVLDRTCFGHQVGEVELEMDTAVRDDAEAAALMQDMDTCIGRFLERYAWAFDVGEPVGKSTAYFAHLPAAGKES